MHIAPSRISPTLEDLLSNVQQLFAHQARLSRIRENSSVRENLSNPEDAGYAFRTVFGCHEGDGDGGLDQTCRLEVGNSISIAWRMSGWHEIETQKSAITTL